MTTIAAPALRDLRSTVRPTVRGGVERAASDAAPPGAPIAPSGLHAAAGACALVANAFAAPEAKLETWLAAVARLTAGSSAGGDVGASVMLVAPPRARLRWMGIEAALAGAYPRPTAQALRREALAGWPRAGNDAVTLGCAPLHAPVGVTSADVEGRGGAAAEHVAFRRRLGLHRFVRAIAPMDHPVGPRALMIQLDGVTPAWRPPIGLLDGLVAAVGPIALACTVRFIARWAAQRRLLAKLSDRQREVFPHLVEGCSEAAIARKIDRSVHTVHDHTKRIYRRLGVSSRLQLRDLWYGRSPGGEPFPSLYLE